MLSNEDELQERSGVNVEDRPCRNCDHAAHPNGRCEEEVSNMGNPYALTDIGICQCFCYEPQDASDILSAEHPEEI